MATVKVSKKPREISTLQALLRLVQEILRRIGTLERYKTRHELPVRVLLERERMKERKRRETELARRQDDIEYAKLVTAEIQKITPKGWSVLDADFEHYGDRESVVEKAYETYANYYEIKLEPGFGRIPYCWARWEPPVRSGHSVVVFGRKRQKALDGPCRDCPHCEGRGWVKNEQPVPVNGNREETATALFDGEGGIRGTDE